MELVSFQVVIEFIVGNYASRYGYDWKRDEAEKNLLRTHTTAVSSRMLYKLAQVCHVPCNICPKACSFSSPKQTQRSSRASFEFLSISFHFLFFSISGLLFKHGGIFRMGLHQRGTFQLIGYSETRLWIAHILPSSTKLKVRLLCYYFNVKAKLGT